MTKPLIETNPYLKNPSTRDKLISRSVRTSCGVEGIKAPTGVSHIEIAKRINKKLHKKR